VRGFEDPCLHAAFHQRADLTGNGPAELPDLGLVVLAQGGELIVDDPRDRMRPRVLRSA
jgi:hypothetical protein